jgi:4-hydroxymandelate oxidase
MARAATAAGVPHVVSSNAGFPLADVGAIGPWWVQAYLTADRADVLPMLRAATDAGAAAVVLTADTPVVGSKRGVDDADWADLDLSWHRGNFAQHVRDAPGVWARDVTEADIGWLAETTGLPVVVKGILRPDDARRCVAAGAAAVWVSTHGGRQLDRAVASATALPTVAGEVGGEVEVYVDGGVRSGLDVLTALALGADAVFLGRTPFYALATAGEAGVARLLEELADELLEALRLAGCRDLREVRDLLPAVPDSPAG